MSQSRCASALECVINVLVGYVIALAAQMVIFPIFGIYVSHAEHAAIGAMFTIVSLVRSYALRRLFNRFHSHG